MKRRIEKMMRRRRRWRWMRWMRRMRMRYHNVCVYSIPYQRSIAMELLRYANTKTGCSFTSIIHEWGSPSTTNVIHVDVRNIWPRSCPEARQGVAASVAVTNETTCDNVPSFDRRFTFEKYQCRFSVIMASSSFGQI